MDDADRLATGPRRQEEPLVGIARRDGELKNGANGSMVEVTVTRVTDADNAAIDAAYRTKYGYFGNFDGILGPPRWGTTLVVEPRG